MRVRQHRRVVIGRLYGGGGDGAFTCGGVEWLREIINWISKKRLAVIWIPITIYAGDGAPWLPSAFSNLNLAQGGNHQLLVCLCLCMVT